jgi:hypothetical protein
VRRSQLESAVLAIATAAVLALGGWWWVANAPPPATSATLAAPPPSPTTAPAGPPDQTYPHPSELLQFDRSQVAELLPERDDVIQHDVGVLTDTGNIDYSGTVPGGARFLLEYACLGEGDLVIEVVTPDGSRHQRRLGCDATVDSLEFATGSTGNAVVRLVADTTRFVGVAVQLVRR